MLRKMLTLGALGLVALAFGVGTASAKPGTGNGAPSPSGHAYGLDGWSDGRF